MPGVPALPVLRCAPIRPPHEKRCGMTYVIGIDPGPVTGIVKLPVPQTTDVVPQVIQCSWNVFDDVLLALIGLPGMTTLAVERFIPSRHGQRGTAPEARRAAVFVQQFAEQVAADYGLACHVRTAAEVKPWATDQRLLLAGLLEPCTGMRHARDGARHALFAAVKDCGLPDPLSHRVGARA